MTITCNCRASTARDLITRPIQDDVYEVGIKCPKCGVFTHSHFYNKELEKIQSGMQVPTNYAKIFDDLQERYKDKINGNTSGTS